MPAKGKTPINLNLDPSLLKRVDDYRFEKRFDTRKDAIEFLLNYALSANPKRTVTVQR